MHFSLICCSVLVFVCHTNAKGYGMSGSGTGQRSFGTIGSGSGKLGDGAMDGYQTAVEGSRGWYETRVGDELSNIRGWSSDPGFSAGSVAGNRFGVSDMTPKPHRTSYTAPDGQGGVQFKEEEGDGSGAVYGKYGYTDAQGLYRIVSYIADQYGFKADIQTNEPGMDGKQSPADVTLTAEKPPANIQEQHTTWARSWGGVDALPVNLPGGKGRYPGDGFGSRHTGAGNTGRHPSYGLGDRYPAGGFGSVLSDIKLREFPGAGMGSILPTGSQEISAGISNAYPSVASTYPATGVRHPGVGSRAIGHVGRPAGTSHVYPATGVRHPDVGSRAIGHVGRPAETSDEYPATGVRHPGVGSTAIRPVGSSLELFDGIPKSFSRKSGY